MKTGEIDSAARTGKPVEVFPSPLFIPNFALPAPLQIKGWALKALEFFDSGPPALLNNPFRSRRVVCFSIHKHAMEVHHG